MRILLASLALVLATGTVFAQSNEIESQIRYYNGMGSHFGYCQGNDFFCIDQIKQTAQRYAVQDASWQCQMAQGQVDQFSVSCNDMCNPNYLPPGSGSTNVSCRSNCQVRCTLPDPNTEVVE